MFQQRYVKRHEIWHKPAYTQRDVAFCDSQKPVGGFSARRNLKILEMVLRQNQLRLAADISVSYVKIGEALDAYQQGLAIAKRLAEQDKTNATWQWDLIVSLYRVGITTAKMGAHDSVGQAQEFLHTALKLADKYRPTGQQLVDGLNGALQNLVH